jgi:outer membrane protein assembly factor BamB
MQDAAAAAQAPILAVSDWRQAQRAGWTFGGRDDAKHDGTVTTDQGVLRIADVAGRNAGSAEIAYAGPLEGPERFALEFRARFAKLGLADESTGDKSLLSLSLGVHTPQGDIGARFSFNLDRYNVDEFTKVVRIDSTKWHDWRLEIDAARRVVAMYRDGEYVCLHGCGAAQPPGLRILVKGTSDAPADVEFGPLRITPLAPEPAVQRVTVRRQDAPTRAGDWPMWRRDVGNTGMSPMRGNIRKPAVAWSYPVGGQAAVPTFLDVDGDGRPEAILTNGGNLVVMRTDGSILWRRRLSVGGVYGAVDLDEDGSQDLVITAGTPPQLTILRGRDGTTRYAAPLLSKIGVAAVRIAKMNPHLKGLQLIAWSHLDTGFCLSFAGGVEQAKAEWTFNWEKTWFTPLVALADMDRDGVTDVVVATYNNVFVFDGLTGATKMHLEWPAGRNYGTIVLKDVDGDGYPDVVVLADLLRKHVAVIKNEGGKSLRLLWDKFYEQIYPEDHVSLRVLNESVDDFDGDGKTELAYAVWDDRKESRWHTLLVDALTGDIKHDIADRYLVGAGAPIEGKKPVLLLSSPSGRAALNENSISVWTHGPDGWAARARLPEGRLLKRWAARDFALNTWSQVSGITTGVPSTVLRALERNHPRSGVYLVQPVRVAFVAMTSEGNAAPTWSLALPPNLPAGAVEDVAQLGSPTADERPLALFAGEDGLFRMLGPNGRTVAKWHTLVGAITMPVAARLRRGDPPSILFFDSRGALQCLRCDAKSGKPRRVWSSTGLGCHASCFYVPHSKPHGVPMAWDVDGDSEQEVLVARQPNLLVALNSDGKVKHKWKLPTVPAQWAFGHVDADGVPDLIVTYPVGEILDVETAAIAGVNGKVLWKRKCGNSPFALCDMDGDGLDDVVMRDLYERRTLSGRTGIDIEPIVMYAGYHTALVPRGPYGSEMQDAPYAGVIWVGGSWSALSDDAQGARRWVRSFASTGTQGVRTDGDGRLELGGITSGQLYTWPELKPVDGPDKEFVCSDAQTGDTRWTVPLGAASGGCVAADVDGDGRKEFVFGCEDGRLIALGAGGRKVWELALPAALGAPIICDVDGSGRMAILVSCADGNLYCVTDPGGVTGPRTKDSGHRT